MRMNVRVYGLFCLMLGLLVFASCASYRSDSANSEKTQKYAMEDSGVVSRDIDGSINSNSVPRTSSVYDEEQEDVRKIIRNAEMAVEVKDVDEMYNKIVKLVKSFDGEEHDKNYYVSDYKRMEVVLKMPPDNLDIFEKELAELVGHGRIKRSKIKSQDITAEYYDISARLESYIASREQLRKIMEEAETVEETLSVQRELTNIQAEIESLQGRVNMWDRLVSMATVRLYIDEIRDPLRRTKTIEWKFNSHSDVLRTMRNGFIIVVNTMYTLIVWGAVIIVASIPVIIPLGVILWIIHRRRKGKNK